MFSLNPEPLNPEPFQRLPSVTRRATLLTHLLKELTIKELTPKRVSDIIREHGSDRMIVNGSADWGISDPLSLVKVTRFLAEDGHPAATIQQLVFENAMHFYSGSPKWRPALDIVPMDPHEFQR